MAFLEHHVPPSAVPCLARRCSAQEAAATSPTCWADLEHRTRPAAVRRLGSSTACPLIGALLARVAGGENSRLSPNGGVPSVPCRWGVSRFLVSGQLHTRPD